jgi:lysyl-tRNA synthetase class 2
MNMTADIDWKPSAPLSALRLRAQVNAAIRAYFTATAALEVETPILSAAANTEPNIQSFHTRFSGPVRGGEPLRYLRTSPEFALKRLLAAGIGDCYELGRVFRDGEAGGRHNPEFTLLEWYRLGWRIEPLMDEVARVLQNLAGLVDRRLTVERLSYDALYRERLGIDWRRDPLAALQAPLAQFGIDPDGLGRDDWLDLLMTHLIQPTLPVDQLLFVHDFPPSQCALARIEGEGEQAVAKRFEAYWGRWEVANGYHELSDADEQAARFASDNQRRRQRGLPTLPIDTALLAALQQGLPDCAGVAVGVDRVLMALSGSAQIADQLAFDFARA